MRYMLGKNNEPTLLVEVTKRRSDTDFDFWVINGNWEGTFVDGNVTVWYSTNPLISPRRTACYVMTDVQILTDNQDRLRGEYGAVFNNFHDPDYVGPIKVIEFPESWRDDIPF